MINTVKTVSKQINKFQNRDFRLMRQKQTKRPSDDAQLNFLNWAIFLGGRGGRAEPAICSGTNQAVHTSELIME